LQQNRVDDDGDFVVKKKRFSVELRIPARRDRQFQIGVTAVSEFA
jgi:hypothetical protein